MFFSDFSKFNIPRSMYNMETNTSEKYSEEVLKLCNSFQNIDLNADSKSENAEEINLSEEDIKMKILQMYKESRIRNKNTYAFLQRFNKIYKMKFGKNEKTNNSFLSDCLQRPNITENEGNLPEDTIKVTSETFTKDQELKDHVSITSEINLTDHTTDDESESYSFQNFENFTSPNLNSHKIIVAQMSKNFINDYITNVNDATNQHVNFYNLKPVKRNTNSPDCTSPDIYPVSRKDFNKGTTPNMGIPPNMTKNGPSSNDLRHKITLNSYIDNPLTITKPNTRCETPLNSVSQNLNKNMGISPNTSAEIASNDLRHKLNRNMGTSPTTTRIELPFNDLRHGLKLNRNMDISPATTNSDLSSNDLRHTLKRKL